jgi:hypothetical protein
MLNESLPVSESVRVYPREWGSIEIRRCRSGYRLVRVALDNAPRLLIAFIGDLHLGSPQCDLDLFKRIIRWIREKNALWVGMGDFLECATRASVGAGVYEQILSPQQQRDQFPPLVESIAHLCVGLIKGNHEERAHKLAGTDPVAEIARDLDVPYLGWEFWGFFTRLGKSTNTRRVYAVHSGAGNKNGGLALAWTDREIRKYADVDLIARAHSHDLGFIPAEKIVFNVTGKNPSVQPEYQYLVSSGHFLKRADSYAAGKAVAGKPAGAMAVEMSLAKHLLWSARPIYLPESELE